MNTPYIHVNEDEVQIIGEPQNLEALGHALLLKAKMGKNFQCTISDGTNIPIKIISSDDILVDPPTYCTRDMLGDMLIEIFKAAKVSDAALFNTVMRIKNELERMGQQKPC